ncbi:MAG: phosphoribosyl-AMP cyclohydrolase [Candidatus Acidiferrum sp.]
MELAFEKMGGLIPAVIQDDLSSEVLMLGFVNHESLLRTQQSGEVHFFSRSRQKLWKKGETSGHVLKVKSILVDCDADALLIRVEAPGPGVCHEGYASCFFRELQADGSSCITAERAFDPDAVYRKAGAE